MAEKELTARDLKLVQYLTEAYGKEKQLETALQAHIGMTTRPPYKKRLQQHLKETKGHARQVERRIKQLGAQVPDVAIDASNAISSVFGKAVAMAQGPLHALRGTSEDEKLLKNAKDEFVEEAAEIAAYTTIETLAEEVGDKETAKLARSIRRDEERMASFLQRQIPTLTKAVVRESIPANERNGGRGRSRSSSRRRTGSGSSRTSSTRSTSSLPSRSGGSSARSRSRPGSSGRSRPGRRSS
ncbi:MAG: ferritin-like domain-containing protein [Solirubrobacteraceae bacterium]|jgi:ferritin-like metal-binding protein YciE